MPSPSALHFGCSASSPGGLLPSSASPTSSGSSVPTVMGGSMRGRSPVSGPAPAPFPALFLPAPSSPPATSDLDPLLPQLLPLCLQGACRLGRGARPGIHPRIHPHSLFSSSLVPSASLSPTLTELRQSPQPCWSWPGGGQGGEQTPPCPSSGPGSPKLRSAQQVRGEAPEVRAFSSTV